ncbi:MAG: hypothetical protein ACKO2P_18765 [Planctomycetota bacterium]
MTLLTSLKTSLMARVTQAVRGPLQVARGVQQRWDRFWFKPADPVVLSLMRVLVGGMLFYTHIVWGMNLPAFFSADGWNSPDVILRMQEGMLSPTFWWYVPEQLMWPVHLGCLSVLFLFWVGCCTRVTSVLAFLITISYSYRAQMANYGLDQINGLLCLYLCVGAGGSALSVDRWWRVRRARRAAAQAGQSFALPPLAPSASTRVAIRLIQLHFCVIYAFAGLSKLQGDAWWNGEAVWLAFSNLEYQSVDMTWTAWYPWISHLATHSTIVWEVFFPVLIWVRPLRPLVLLGGFCMHLGIGGLMGMWTFGLIMIFGHVAFWSPGFVRRVLARLPHHEFWLGPVPALVPVPIPVAPAAQLPDRAGRSAIVVMTDRLSDEELESFRRDSLQRTLFSDRLLVVATPEQSRQLAADFAGSSARIITGEDGLKELQREIQSALPAGTQQSPDELVA